MVIGADVLIVPVLHAEATRDSAQLYEAQPLVQVPRVGVAGHHGVELHHPEAVGLRLRQAVLHHLVPDLHHGGQVFFGIGADHDLHAAKSPILLVNLPISAVLILAHRTEKGKISAFSAPGNGGVENCAFPRIFHRRGLQPPRC